MAAVALSQMDISEPSVMNLIIERFPVARQDNFHVSHLQMYLWALGRLGPAAAKARPAIAAFTNNSSVRIRDRAQEAIRRIDRESQPASGSGNPR
jgi:hypothetical protein